MAVEVPEAGLDVVLRKEGHVQRLVRLSHGGPAKHLVPLEIDEEEALRKARKDGLK